MGEDKGHKALHSVNTDVIIVTAIFNPTLWDNHHHPGHIKWDHFPMPTKPGRSVRGTLHFVELDGRLEYVL